MPKRFLLTFVSFVFCVPCFAEELPSVPELIKRMYDYRMSINDIRFDAVVRKPICTITPQRQNEAEIFFFHIKSGQIRCDKETKWGAEITALEQHLFTPEFYFYRFPYGDNPMNEGISLYLSTEVLDTFRTFDLRRIGMNPESLDVIPVKAFDYDVLMNSLYPPRGSEFRVERDQVDGKKLWKISYVIADPAIVNTYWIDDQRGVNLVRFLSEGEGVERMSDYAVTLERFSSSNNTDIWFPKKVIYWVKMPDYELKEEVTIDNVRIGAEAGNTFALSGLNIPVGYLVLVDGKQVQYWDGKELVNKITFEIEPVSGVRRMTAFLIANAVFFAILAFWFLYKLLQRRSK